MRWETHPTAKMQGPSQNSMTKDRGRPTPQTPQEHPPWMALGVDSVCLSVAED